MRYSLLPWLALAAPSLAAPTLSQTTVKASTGYYSGNINATYTNVREFLNIPYGQTTAGKNRFMPPIKVPMSSNSFDATQYAKACPQYVSAVPAIWNKEVPQYLQYWGNDELDAGESAVFTSEDCLSLAIWTPANATSASGLPVAMFMTGGGFQTNGILVPGQLPPHWVELSQKHIVVTINYRMNIMGFPNAAGVYEQNLGILDQRMSLEWVRDNIAYFGGDPSRIMIWGQSAGASSIDIHNYAYWEDPIAHAFFAESGSVLAFPISQYDVDHTNFTTVAKAVGCDSTDAEQELECMQQVDYNDIINFMGHHQDNATLVKADADQPRLSFSAIPDERIVFSNYTARYQSGMVTKAPMIYGNTANEGAAFQPFPVDDPLSGINQTAADQSTIGIMCCAAESSTLRDSIGLTTYRYQYAGNWTNQDPLPWMGAFHSSDLVMWFGSYPEGEGAPTKLEGQASATMGELLLSFVTDPYNGPEALGWPAFDPTARDGGTMLRFGADGKTVQKVAANDVQAVCTDPSASYDHSP